MWSSKLQQRTNEIAQGLGRGDDMDGFASAHFQRSDAFLECHGRNWDKEQRFLKLPNLSAPLILVLVLWEGN